MIHALGRITLPPSVVLKREVDKLLKSMYRAPHNKAKREVLRSIIQNASQERAAFVNGPFYDPLSYILITANVCDIVMINHLEKRIEELEKEIAELVSLAKSQ